jgi:hypothetical protein
LLDKSRKKNNSILLLMKDSIDGNSKVKMETVNSQVVPSTNGQWERTQRRERFAEFVKIQAMENRVILREEEKTILRDGTMRFELPLDEARGVMLVTAQQNGYALQSDVETQIAELITMFSGRKNGKISRQQFEQAVEMYRVKSHSGIPQSEMQVRIKALMEQKSIKPKRSGWILRSRKWYNRI